MEITSVNTNKRRLFARRFSRRVTTCFAVCGFLAFVNWYTSPHYWWVVWVIAGWGLSILLSLIRYLFDQDDEDDCRNREKSHLWKTVNWTPPNAWSSSSA